MIPRACQKTQFRVDGTVHEAEGPVLTNVALTGELAFSQSR